ncbi:Saposin B-type domain-containing protein [Mycena venus]|uniref:Saposin B-type domain-containing protein n=1 Tax=Mycena venus TaxID=2733690 RepID=A0A8H7CVB3_9AGAR|nr:Saposin B-type domain-containing protein [Mycena venus]
MSSELNGSLGATEIGSVLGAFLFGAMTLQSYNYFRDFPRDSSLLRSTVAVVWLLELGHTMCSWHALYSQTVTFYGQPEYVSSPPSSEALTILFASLLYTTVQTFFANRARILSGQWYIMAVACTLSALRFIANMGSMGLLLHYGRVSILLEWRWLVSAALSLGLTVDILITLAMCYFLQKMRSTESTRVRTTVETLIIWSIESTVLTSATSIMQIILFTTRTDLVWTLFFILQAKLFSNSMLASLNGRRRFLAWEQEPSQVLHFVSFRAPKADMIAVSFSRDGKKSCANGSLPAEVSICSKCSRRSDWSSASSSQGIGVQEPM